MKYLFIALLTVTISWRWMFMPESEDHPQGWYMLQACVAETGECTDFTYEQAQDFKKQMQKHYILHQLRKKALQESEDDKPAI